MSKISRIIDKKVYNNYSDWECFNKIFDKVFGLDNVIIVEKCVRNGLSLSCYDEYNFCINDINQSCYEVGTIKILPGDKYLINCLYKKFYNMKMKRYTEKYINNLSKNPSIRGLIIRKGVNARVVKSAGSVYFSCGVDR